MKHPNQAVTDPRQRLTLRLASFLSVFVGGGSLIAFGAFLWIGSVHFIDLGFDPTTMLVWNGFLSLVFFAQHSGMIRQVFRGRTARFIPPHLHPAVYSIASGATLFAVLVLWQRSPLEICSVGPPWRWLLRAGFAVAIVGFVAGIRALRGFDGFGQRPVRDLLRGRTRSPSPLTVRGPYRWVRHPLYTCVLLMVWSCPVVTADRLLFNLLWSLWIVVGTALEERDLIDEFGDAYVRYREVVPMLIPWSLRPRWPVDGQR